MGVLVQLKNTAYLRIALLPTMPLIAMRALLALDFSCGKLEQAQSNAIFFVSCHINHTQMQIEISSTVARLT